MAYYFKLPKVTELTLHQQMAIDETKPIALSGAAGTGKTVVSLYRHIGNIKNLNKSSILITFTKTLGEYLKLAVNSISSTSVSNNVFSLKEFTIQHSVNKNTYPLKITQKISNEIIIDEAQDLDSDTLKEIKKGASYISYGADFNQQLYERKVTEEELKSLFPDNQEYYLEENFRNTYYIMNFVKNVCNNLYIPTDSIEELKETRIGIKPVLYITDSFEKEIDQIVEIIDEFYSDTHNIAIFLPFADKVEKYFTELQNRGIRCSQYYNKLKIDNVEIENIHITTFKSAKGLEFDTVIIPSLHNMKDYIKKYSMIKEEDYYVAFTRTRRNLYLLSEIELDFIKEDFCDIKKNFNNIPSINLDEEIPF